MVEKVVKDRHQGQNRAPRQKTAKEVRIFETLNRLLLIFQKVVFLNFFFNCISFLAVATDIMVTTGRGSSGYLDSVETIRITEAKDEVTVETCLKSVPSYPLKVSNAAGTTLINGEPLICGGRSPTTDTCYKLVNNEWREAPQLPTGRSNLAMTKIAQTTFIVYG